MAHLIESSDFIFTRKGDSRAWHNLDTQVEFSTDDWKTQGFNYSVDARELSSAYGPTGQYGLISSRNGKLMRLCSDDAVVDQPAAMALWFETFASELGAPMVSAGTLEGTARYFFAAELPFGNLDLGGGDRLERHVVLTGSYDGNHPQRVMGWAMRPVCNNTLPSASADDGVYWKARAGKSERLTTELAKRLAAQIAAIPAEVLQKQSDVFGALTTTKIDPTRDTYRFAHLIAGDGAKLLDRVINLDPALRGASILDRCLAATIDQDAWKAVRASDLSPLARKLTCNTLEGMGADLPTARETAWGLLNAATQTFDHDSRRESVQQVEARMFQSFAGEKQNALVLASAIANTQW